MSDWNYSWSLLSLVVGLASGFQGVYERLQKDSLTAVTTLSGGLYLLTRGLFPAILFLGLYRSRIIENNLWAYALTLGAGAEVVLRTKFFIKQSCKAGQEIEDLLVGPLDLLQWYQNLLLEGAQTSLASRRKEFVKKSLPEGASFNNLRNLALNHLNAWRDPTTQSEIRNSIDGLHKEFDNELKEGEDSNVLEERYRLKLGFLILDKVGKKGFQTLLSQ